MVIILWAIFCLFVATHGWQQYSTVPAPVVNDVPRELPNRELKLMTADFKITQKERTIGEPKKVDKKQILNPFKNSEAGIQDKDFTRRKSESLETSIDENQYRVLQLQKNKSLKFPKVHAAARRIFHGHKTKIKHFPFLVTVHVFSSFVCGGTIIKSDLVLTAAACLKSWQEWLRKLPTTQESSTDVNVQTTVDTNTTEINITTSVATISTDMNTPSTIDTMTTDGKANVTDKVNTTTTITTTVTAKNESSEDSGRSSSYETAAPDTTASIVTYETPEPELKPSPGFLSVRIGTNYYRLGGKIVHVAKAYFHPSYNKANLRNNLVIMRLERRLKLKGRRVRKIHIHPAAIDLSENSAVTVAGWGAKTYHNKVYNVLWNLIHKAVMMVSPLDQCASTYNTTFVTATNFCALNEHHEGACNRDAGNPAVVDGKLVGIVSFGPPECGAWDSPTVFTNIGYYAEWIQEIRSIKTVTNNNQTSSSSKENNSSEHSTPETTTELTTHKDLT